MAEIRAELEADRAELVGTLATMDLPAEEPLMQMLKSGLKDLEDAIGKIDAGVYGHCESCALPIGERRLRSLPTSRQCLECEGVAMDDAAI